MFVRQIHVESVTVEGERKPCLLRWIDSFAMRNFTNDAAFDDTLPISDGRMEIGHRVSLDRLQVAMQDWFLRKGYLQKEERLELREGISDSSIRQEG
jgi:hypothetical protein